MLKPINVLLCFLLISLDVSFCNILLFYLFIIIIILQKRNEKKAASETKYYEGKSYVTGD